MYESPYLKPGSIDDNIRLSLMKNLNKLLNSKRSNIFHILEVMHLLIALFNGLKPHSVFSVH